MGRPCFCIDMFQFIFDAFDLALFRAKPLEHYSYDWRVPVFWLTVLAGLRAVANDGLHAGLPEKLLFYEVLTWALVVLLSLFLGWWLRMGKQLKAEDSLFPLVVQTFCLEFFLMPLLLLVSDDDLLFVAMLAMFYQLAVLTNALMRSTGATLGRTLLGLLAFVPTLLVLSTLSAQVALDAGWIAYPADMQAFSAEPAAALPNGEQ